MREHGMYTCVDYLKMRFSTIYFSQLTSIWLSINLSSVFMGEVFRIVLDFRVSKKCKKIACPVSIENLRIVPQIIRIALAGIA